MWDAVKERLSTFVNRGWQHPEKHPETSNAEVPQTALRSESLVPGPVRKNSAYELDGKRGSKSPSETPAQAPSDADRKAHTPTPTLERSSSSLRLLNFYSKKKGSTRSNSLGQLEGRETEEAARIRGLERDMQKLENQNRSLTAQNDTLRRRTSHLDEETMRLANQVRSLVDRNSRLEHDNQRQTNELQRLQNELSKLNTLYIETCSLLEQRTKELKGAEKFLSQADSLSGAEVISMVTALNTEIMQTAALMADSLEFSLKQPETDESAAMYKDAVEFTASLLGEDLVKVLQTKTTGQEGDFDVTAVQIALQICMAGCCSRIISSWTLDSGDGDQTLMRIYAKIMETEESAVARRWRSMTRAGAKSRSARDFASSHIVESVVDTLIVAGWTSNETQRREKFLNKFSEKTNLITDMAMRLNRAIGEDVVSQDLSVLDFQPLEKFDAITMNDAYAEDLGGRSTNGRSQHEMTDDRIVGTTDLGLWKTGNDAQPMNILLKPKVVLWVSLLA